MWVSTATYGRLEKDIVNDWLLSEEKRLIDQVVLATNLISSERIRGILVSATDQCYYLIDEDQGMDKECKSATVLRKSEWILQVY